MEKRKYFLFLGTNFQKAFLARKKKSDIHQHKQIILIVICVWVLQYALKDGWSENSLGRTWSNCNWWKAQESCTQQGPKTQMPLLTRKKQELKQAGIIFFSEDKRPLLRLEWRDRENSRNNGSHLKIKTLDLQ